MRVSAIAAMDLAYGLGHHGAIPWRLPSDLRRFRAITIGHPVLMGRATWESIGRPLPGRTNIVLSRGATIAHEGVLVARSLDEGLAMARAADQGADPEAMILGGGVLFAEALPRCTRLYLSMVGNLYPADTFFPRAWGEGWHAVRSEAVPADAQHADPHLFVVFERPATS